MKKGEHYIYKGTSVEILHGKITKHGILTSIGYLNPNDLYSFSRWTYDHPGEIIRYEKPKEEVV